jgi:hypothetical protein
MKKLCCYLGLDHNKVTYRNRDHQFANLSSVFRNIPIPTIELEKLDYHLYPMNEELEIGQLFYFTKTEKPGSIQIDIEPLDFTKYHQFVKGYRLFATSPASTNYSNSLKHRVNKHLNDYYESVVKIESRNQKIDEIINK